jgi:hypothetical protein
MELIALPSLRYRTDHIVKRKPEEAWCSNRNENALFDPRGSASRMPSSYRENTSEGGGLCQFGPSARWNPSEIRTGWDSPTSWESTGGPQSVMIVTHCRNLGQVRRRKDHRPHGSDFPVAGPLSELKSSERGARRISWSRYEDGSSVRRVLLRSTHRNRALRRRGLHTLDTSARRARNCASIPALCICKIVGCAAHCESRRKTLTGSPRHLSTFKRVS